MTATIDLGGNTTLYQFDAVGNETLVADPYGHGTSYAFNKANQLTKLTDADANATSYVLDGVGNATIVIDPNMNRTTQQFDGDQQVTQQITGRGYTLVYGFDGVGRLTSSPSGTFGYNKEGQLTLASNSYGAYSLTYDDGGRVTLVTEPNSLTLSFGYDKAGNRTLVTDSLGGSETSIYDAANFLTTRTYQGQGQTLGVQFTNNAEDWNTTLARYGNGTLVATGETGYDNVGQATTILNTHGTATVDQFLNAYNNGNVTSVIGTQNGSTTTLGLTYDEDNELTGAGTTSYTFDSNGNRTGSAGVTTGNELTSDATWSYTYDADGNLIQKSKGVGGTIITIGLGGGGGGGGGIPGGGETWTYGYNPQDQLTQVQHFTGPLVTLALTVDYDYDAFGNRIETTSIASGTTTVTKDAYDGWDPGQPAPTGNENFNVWAQTNASGTLTSRYLYSDRVDQQLGRIDVNSGTATVYWTLEDYQNSVRDVIDNTGALKDSIQYDAFGNITSETDPTYRGSYAWTGRELDAETDLQYNRARWYDSTTGRWMTRDPLGFDAGDSNLYRYVKNGPTEGMDPSGLQDPTRQWQNQMNNQKGGQNLDPPAIWAKHKAVLPPVKAPGVFVPERGDPLIAPLTKGAFWRVTWVLEQAGAYRALYSMEAAELQGRTDVEAGELRNLLKAKYRKLEPPEIRRTLDALYPRRINPQGPVGTFNPGKTNEVVNQTFKVGKVVGKVFLVVMLATEANAVLTSDDWAKQLGSSSSGFLGAVGGGTLGGMGVGAGLGALGCNPFTIAGGAILGGISGGAAGYKLASGAFETLYDVIAK